MASTAGADVGSPVGALEISGNDPENLEANRVSDSSRRYGGGMVHQHKTTIVGCIVVVALFAVAVALGAISLQQSSEALELANANAKAIESENFNAIPVPAGNEASPPTPNVSPVSTPNPSTAPPTPTGAPTEPHPLNPQWFQTNHEDWQLFNASNAEREDDNQIHSHTIGWMVCNKRALDICSYDVYCPKGKGSGPFHGGPPKVHNSDTLEETQWAPYGPFTSDNVHEKWVQIGRIKESDGEFEESNYGQCWKYDEFYAGDGVDIEERWGEEHRMWLLCCDKVNDEGDGDARK